jgi:hypothetical protein
MRGDKAGVGCTRGARRVAKLSSSATFRLMLKTLAVIVANIMLRHVERAHAVGAHIAKGHWLDQVFEARHRQPPFASRPSSAARPCGVSVGPPPASRSIMLRTTIAVTVAPVMPACSQSVSLATTAGARGCSALGLRLRWTSLVVCSCRGDTIED